MTNSNDREEIERLVCECIERFETTGDWQLDAVCQGRAERRAAVERVLRSLDGLGFLEPERAAPEAGEEFGSYRVLAELGRGAMGIVHLAEHVQLGRRVALKRLGAHVPLGSKALTRFQREAELLSRIEHPQIARVYESGEVGGVPFLAMQHVAGSTLAERISKRGRAARAAEIPALVAILTEIAEGLEGAHGAGVVHRDVKPANVLLTSDGNPVLVDFGLARLADADGGFLTRSGDTLGTPAYMAPEQIDPARGEIGVRSDIYGLGATAWECLTGEPPFQATSREAMFRAILRGERAPLRLRAPACPRDLRIVIERALSPDPAARFASAQELAAELARVRDNRPILTQAPSPHRRLWKWSRRNPVAATWLAVATLALCASTWAIARLDDAAERERTLRIARQLERTIEDPVLRSQWLTARVARYPDERLLFEALSESLGQIHESARVDFDGAVTTVRSSQRRVLVSGYSIGARLMDAALRPIRSLKVTPLAEAEERALGYPSLAETDYASAYRIAERAIDLSPDGRFAVAGCVRGAFALFDAETGLQIGPTMHGTEGQRWKVEQVMFGPSGDWFVVTHSDGTASTWSIHGERLVDLRADPTGAMTAWRQAGDRPRSRAHPLTAWSLTMSPDGDRIVTGGGSGRRKRDPGQEQSLRIWDAATGKLLAPPIEHHTATIWDVACSDERIVTASDDGTTALFDHAGTLIEEHADDSAWVRAEFSADGTSYVVTSEDGAVLWADAANGEIRARWNGVASILDFVISPESGTLLVAGFDRAIRAYSDEGKLLQTTRGHEQAVTQIEWLNAAAGSYVTSSEDGSVRCWSTRPTKARAVRADPGGTPALHRLDDGRFLVIGTRGRLALLSSSGEPIRLARIPGQPRYSIGVDERHERLFVSNLQGRAFEWPFGTDQSPRELAPNVRSHLAIPGPDPERFLTTIGAAVRIHERAGTPRDFDWLVPSSYGGSDIVAISRRVDRGAVVFGNLGGTLSSVSVESPRQARGLFEFESLVSHVGFSRDGSVILAGSRDGTAIAIDRESGDVHTTLTGHQGVVFDIQLDASAGLIATACGDGRIRVWQYPRGGEPIAVFGTPGDAMRGLALLAESRRVVSLSQSGWLRWWTLDVANLLRTARRELPSLSPQTQARYPELFDK